MHRVLFSASVVACLLSGVTAGCDDRWGVGQIERMKAERARIDPPALWSMEVVGSQDDGRPVLICANSRIVDGFSTVSPTFGGRPCTREKPDGDMIPTQNGSRYRCHLNGVVYAVSSGVVGDRARDFLVSSSVHPMTGDGPDYARDMRFRRIGVCPVGWKLGEATDQHGVRKLAVDPDH